MPINKSFFMDKRVSLGATVVICVLGIGLPLFWDLPGHWRVFRVLQNSGHTVLFFAMGFCLAWRKLPWYLVISILLVIGVGIEIIQYIIGKDCDIHDVVLDNLGSICGVGFFYSVKNRSIKYGFLSLTVAATVFYLPVLIAISYAMQWRNFPILTNFDEPGRKYLIDHHEGSTFELLRLPQHFAQQGSGNSSMVLHMGCPPMGWPGVALIDLAADWRGFTNLNLDVWLYDNSAITLGIALRGIDNRSDHHDIAQRFALQPGFNRVQWPLRDIIQRSPNGADLLGKIGQVILFCMPEPTRTGNSSLAFDNLRLEP